MSRSSADLLRQVKGEIEEIDPAEVNELLDEGALWHAYGVVPASEGEEAFLASTPILLLDRNGFERVGFAVEHLTPEGLSHDLRLLIAD